MKNTFYLFDPIQYKEFGFEFYEGNKFSYRTQEKNRFGFKIFYIPWGPNCEDEKGFSDFLEYWNKRNFYKIKIDLPLILDDEIKENVISMLKHNSFKETDYIQEEETILITPKNQNILNKEVRYYDKKGKKNYDVEIRTNLIKEEIEEIYKVYVASSRRIGYVPKNISVFERLAQSTICAIGRNKKTNEVEGFILGYKFEINSKSYNQKEFSNILQIIFIGGTDASRKSYLGYSLHKELFIRAFENYEVDIIDFHGASRTQNRSYIKFKESFGGEYVKLPGSFERLKFF